MDATSPERASLEQASLSQPLASCADIFSSSICGLLSMSGDRAVYRCFIPAFLDAHADPGENLQMVMEMTSLCSTTNPTYVHLLCTAAPGPDPPQDPSRTFYFFLSNDCLSRQAKPPAPTPPPPR